MCGCPTQTNSKTRKKEKLTPKTHCTIVGLEGLGIKNLATVSTVANRRGQPSNATNDSSLSITPIKQRLQQQVLHEDNFYIIT